MKNRLCVIAVLPLILSACCDCDCDKVSEEIALPEVNDENCKTENILNLKLPKAAREEFAGLCFRRTDFVKKSSGQQW